MKRMIVIAGALAIACAPTMRDVLTKKDKGEGTSVVYPIDKGKAWTAAEDVLRDGGAGALEEHPDKNMILTTFLTQAGQQTLVSYAGVFFEPAASGTRVTCVVSRPALALGSITESDFHSGFGKTLHIAPPPPPAPEVLPACSSSADCQLGTCVERYCRR